MTYEWYSEAGTHHSESVTKPWKRLRSCKAKTLHIANGKYEWFALVSYSTPICVLRRETHTEGDSVWRDWTCFYTSAYKCSNTTRQHVSKFLADVAGHPYSYSVLKACESDEEMACCKHCYVTYCGAVRDYLASLMHEYEFGSACDA